MATASQTANTRRPRTADPWRDTDVIDARAPRFNQTVVGIVALAAQCSAGPCSGR